MSLTNLLLPTYRQMLRTLAGLLAKAQADMPARAEALLSARLADDMLPLAAQIRFALFQAQEAVFRLRGAPVPEWLTAIAAEGRAAETMTGSMADAIGLIDAALSFLDGLTGDVLDDGAGRAITIVLPGGLIFDMTGADYARDWALPQFYFHVVTAYAILRHEGVAIGKAEYVPHMFGYLRPAAQDAA